MRGEGEESDGKSARKKGEKKSKNKKRANETLKWKKIRKRK